MRDSVKMWLLLFAGIAFTAYFLGKGLTADNYSFSGEPHSESTGDHDCLGGYRDVIAGFSDHHQ